MSTVQSMACSTVWGGTNNIDTDLETAGLRASVYAQAADGSRGGDIYYMSLCGADVLTRMAIADVVGHGEAVNEISRWLYDALAQRVDSVDGNGVLTDLNQLAGENAINAMTTMAVVAYDRSDRNLHLAFAGHPPVLIRRGGDSSWSVARTGTAGQTDTNLPLGVLEDTVYEQHHMPLDEGDMVFLHTDGLVEARNRSGELYGDDRLREVLNSIDSRDPADVKREVLKDLRSFTGGEFAHDDLTLIAAQMR